MPDKLIYYRQITIVKLLNIWTFDFEIGLKYLENAHLPYNSPTPFQKHTQKPEPISNYKIPCSFALEKKIKLFT